jgi:hypothetical protein
MRDLPPPSMAAGKGNDVAMEELTLSALTGDVDVNFKSAIWPGVGGRHRRRSRATRTHGCHWAARARR